MPRAFPSTALGRALLRPSLAWHKPVLAAGLLAVAFGITACQPTVKVEAPDKPIVINLNVKIEQEVRIKVERDVDDLLRENEDLF